MRANAAGFPLWRASSSKIAAGVRAGALPAVAAVELKQQIKKPAADKAISKNIKNLLVIKIRAPFNK